MHLIDTLSVGSLLSDGSIDLQAYSRFFGEPLSKDHLNDTTFDTTAAKEWV